jgi:hypothetical protein
MALVGHTVVLGISGFVRRRHQPVAEREMLEPERLEEGI